MNKILKEIKGVFKQPIKKYYFGKIIFGCPYFYPSNFNSTIISYRKLKLRSEENYNKYVEGRSWLIGKDSSKFSNLPMVRRNKDRIIKIFGSYYFFEIGFPIKIRFVELGWKDKWESPRHEWDPQFHIYFFGLQFCIFWICPSETRDHQYWEQILWWLKYSDEDIKKAEETWPWTDVITKESTWDKTILL